VIFYQNMPNLHNRYKSAERKIKKKNPEQTKFDGIVIGWSSSKMVSGSCALPPRWLPQCSCVVIESSFDPGERLQAKVIGPERNVNLICNSSLYTHITKIKSISPSIAKKCDDN
jgi:hypothetical protein